MPSPLYIAAPQRQERPAVSDTRPAGRPRPGDTAGPDEAPPDLATLIRQQAVAAGLYAAGVVIETIGRQEYFHVGFYEGMTQALQDRRVGVWDRADGERRGWEDSEAREVGDGLAVDAARDAATGDAERQVEEQFLDLGTEPRYLPRAGYPDYHPEPPEVPEPTVFEVLDEFPIDRVVVHDSATEAWLGSWGWDAGLLYGADDYSAFYDSEWDDGAAAFGRWSERADLSAFYQVLSASDRLLFEDLFAEAFATGLAMRYESDLRPAFESGLAKGWDYGSFVRCEHEFRVGFRAGWIAAVEDAALARFQSAYPAAYQDAYRAAFTDWSTHLKTVVLDATLEEENRDGIFEPGESVQVAYRLANYGGVGGRVAIDLDGPALEAPSQVWIDLPARAVHVGRPIETRISEQAGPRSDSEIELVLGEASRVLPLRVSRPLSFDRASWELERSNLDGTAELQIELRNESRLPVAGQVALTTDARPGLRMEWDLGTLDPGEARRVVLDVVDLDPLDLIAGRVALVVDLLGTGGVPQDSLVCHVPDAARDLRNRDLLLYAARLAGQRPGDPRQVAEVRALLVTRLREDWKVVAAGSGNPYKFDYRNGAATTALGDLVRTYLGLDPTARDHDVFAGLSGDVLELAERLPGTHPFLRSYVRKLAQELP